MCRSLVGLIGVCSFLTISPVSASVTPLVNGNFEAGGTTGWYTGAGLSSAYSVSPIRSLMLIGNNNWAYQYTPCTENTTFLLMLAARSTSVFSQTLSLQARYFDSNWNPIPDHVDEVSVDVTNDPSWTWPWEYAKTPAGAAWLEVGIHADTTNGPVYVDNVLAQGDTTILFIGNSFTYGGPNNAVVNYHPEYVTDLNASSINPPMGGMPAIFAELTTEAGLHYDVYHETVGGKGLDYHYTYKSDVIGHAWDVTSMHGYSTLDQANPGNPDLLISSVSDVATLLHDKNPNNQIHLMSTWSRADETYQDTSSPWYGDSITQMALDVRAAYDEAAAHCPYIKDVIPVGQVWNRAITSGLAEADPYASYPTKADLWWSDGYHGSNVGYYLEALTEFGAITGYDPRSFAGNERAASELGISSRQVISLEQTAYDELVSDGFAGLKPFSLR